MRITVVLFGATVLDLHIGDGLELKPIRNRNRFGSGSGWGWGSDRSGSGSERDLDRIWIWNWIDFGSGPESDRNGIEPESESETETESETELGDESEPDQPSFGYGAPLAHTELAGVQVHPLTEGEPDYCA